MSNRYKLKNNEIQAIRFTDADSTELINFLKENGIGYRLSQFASKTSELWINSNAPESKVMLGSWIVVLPGRFALSLADSRFEEFFEEIEDE